MAANNTNTNNQQLPTMTPPSNCWGNVPKPIVEDMNFAAIVKNQKKEKVLKQATEREKIKLQEERDLEEALVKSLEMATLQEATTSSTLLGGQGDDDEEDWDLLNQEDDFKFILPPEVLEFLKSEEEELAAAEKAAIEGCDSDAVIAQMLQAQFDKEYNEELKRIEKAQNKQSKITVCLDKYIKPYIRDVGEDDDSDYDYDEDDLNREKRDWDRFETNERRFEAIPKCGYGLDKDGEMITKHDEKLCGVRNACRMMSLPLEFATGDGAGFDMKLSNRQKSRSLHLNDFKHFNVRFGKQNNFVIINMWAEKEMQAAPKLKDALLSAAEWIAAYDEVVTAMHKLYNEAKLVHADLSEYNILWHDGKCWFIDVAQSVEPQHPSALEFLMRDCNNIVSFFEKKGVPNCHTKEQLFEHITSLNAETINVAMLERIHTKGANIQLATAPNQDECPLEAKPLEYPFDLAWEKTTQNVNVDCKMQAALAENKAEMSSSAVMAQPIVVNTITDTANI
ncbi:serine/threonine-protein kinase RIO3-like [Musca vetustissima]|uniref:serine/threonine-protein kinase RIO3-like n=1 Tax=Musca vetustissima TaxID=27455 RepID=UPI002AB76A39|nr:serine/threonine-protein kinase RIO3-like [Musca vetustissima]